MKLIGPFREILTMDHLPPFGHIEDHLLHLVKDGGILVEGDEILQVDRYVALEGFHAEKIEIPFDAVATPGLIDSHTHLCFAGTRSKDYTLRLQGMSYQEIQKRGGGIWDTVEKTRASTEDELYQITLKKAEKLHSFGVTTAEVKTGYGLNLEDEIKMLEVIQRVTQAGPLDLISTCLAAHLRPPGFQTNEAYLNFIQEELLPLILEKGLSKRVDIFIEDSAFSLNEARSFLTVAKGMGFSLVVHGDQFSKGGVKLASEIGALSVDHLEQSGREEAEALKKGGVIPIVLPGASLGLGEPFAKARLFLDVGLPLVIASDFNPGSAPMGDLLTQAALLGAYEKLTMAETWAAITLRAAKALELEDRGILRPNMKADIAIFPAANTQEILYFQGSMKPEMMIKGGRLSKW